MSVREFPEMIDMLVNKLRKGTPTQNVDNIVWLTVTLTEKILKKEGACYSTNKLNSWVDLGCFQQTHCCSCHCPWTSEFSISSFWTWTHTSYSLGSSQASALGWGTSLVLLLRFPGFTLCSCWLLWLSSLQTIVELSGPCSCKTI